MTDLLAPAALTVVPYGPEALDGDACAQLIAAVLYEAMYDASRGQEDALVWLWSDDARHYAGLLEIMAWPPSAEALARTRADRMHIRNGSSK